MIIEITKYFFGKINKEFSIDKPVSCSIRII